jgi:hypothetical protein
MELDYEFHEQPEETLYIAMRVRKHVEHLLERILRHAQAKHDWLRVLNAWRRRRGMLCAARS